jgi:hypothetical protein
MQEVEPKFGKNSFHVKLEMLQIDYKVGTIVSFVHGLFCNFDFINCGNFKIEHGPKINKLPNILC